jgi:hypothetical protein
MDHTNPYDLHQNHSNHLTPYHLVKEDPRPLIIVSTTVMTVVHFIKVSTIYPQVVISSLAKRLEKPLFAIVTLSLVYDPEITICRYKGLLRVICQA